MSEGSPPADGRFSTRRWDASEQIASELRRYIERNELTPGARIGTEKELAVEFDVSRPTLREALRLLGSSHLIESTQGRNGGVFVAATPNEGMGRSVSEAIASMLAADSVTLPELIEARIFLEVPLAGVAARNATDEIATELERAIADATEHEPGSPAFNAADGRFHRAIARAAGNDLLVAFTNWTLDVLQPSLVAFIGPRVDKDDILDQHRAILRAIRRGQVNAAETAMRRHIEHLQTVVASLEG